MRVALLTVQVPFVHGGAEVLTDSLERALKEAGHQPVIVALPFKWYPPSAVVDHTLGARLMDVSESNGVPIDRAIGLKFPAWMAYHPSKTLWVVHQHRQAYEQFDAGLGDLVDRPDGRSVRDFVKASDQMVLAEARAVYTISRNVSARLEKYSGVKARHLYSPPAGAELFRCEEAEPYFFFPSRINATKRQGLVLQALAKCREDVKVVFAGAPDDPAELTRMQQRAAQLGVADRVRWAGRIDDDEKIALYARCRGVVFPPIDEDYGYITLEAMLSSKPVITLNDSGGVLEFVSHGVNGLVAEPDAMALAEAMDVLWARPDLAQLYGKASREVYESHNISWQNIVSVLVE